MSRSSDTNRDSQSSVWEVFGSFLKLGLTSFGGPIAHLAYFRNEFVEKKCWISDDQYGQLVALCQFLPGPASSQVGFAIGLSRAGWLGALSAFLAFTLPSVVLLILFAALLPLMSGEFYQSAIQGLKLVACAVVFDAVWGMAKKLCSDWFRRFIALMAALLLIMFGSVWVQCLVVLVGAGIGLYKYRRQETSGSCLALGLSYGAPTGLALFIVFLILLLGLPVLSEGNSLISISQIFYQAGSLVFGGGHVVLPLLEEAVVSTELVSSSEFLAGYGASQAIPGPMFSFAAYLGAILDTDASSVLTAAVALVFMFLPGFLLVAAALPFWSELSTNQAMRGAVTGVNAVVVGLLGAALYDPIITSGIKGASDALIVSVAIILLMRFRLSALWVVVWCVVASVGVGFIA